jgi:hypothetical protein
MRATFGLLLAALLVAGCGGSGGGNDGDGGADGARDAATGGDTATTGDAPAGDGATTGDAGGDAAQPPSTCAPLPAPTGTIVNAGPGDADQLRGIVAAAQTGTTILLADGTYDLSGGDYTHRLSFDTPGVTLRGQSGNRENVILDGNYVTQEIISIGASNVTIADLTVKRAYNHPIHVTGRADADITGTRIYDVHVIDPGQQAIKINASSQGHYADHGRVECSLIELTAAGRPSIRDNCYTGGIDGHAAQGWEIRLNTIRGFWCLAGLSEHGVHFWSTSRDTLVERNQILDCARGIGFGLGQSGDPSDRVYADNPYPSAGYLGHIDGIIRNNFVWATIAGHDSGISLEQAKGTQVLHNSVESIAQPFSSIEWRWGNTEVWVVNNLASHDLVPRDGATAHASGNIPNANPVIYTNAVGGDLHLDVDTAAIAVDHGVDVAAGLCDDDIDGQARTGTRDVGADEL